MNPDDRDDPSPDAKGAYSRSWDDYVDQLKSEGQEWPGDDWGNAPLWDAWFARLFTPHEVAQWQKAVEIGQGTGKYTARVLEAGCREVLAADVSPKFLDLCRQRQSKWVDDGRLHLVEIDERDPLSLSTAVRQHGWQGKVDALFSIDTLVHLTWTQITAVLAASTEFLKPDAWLIFSFADGTTEPGFHKLMVDISRTLAAAGDPATGCFHWASPSLVRATAERLGFEVLLCEPDDQHHRDGHFVGRFRDVERAAAARALMHSA